MGEGDLILHLDFSENYLCKYGNEIQSVQYGDSHQQATLHTVVAYTTQGVMSICSLSASMRHDPAAIWAHTNKVLHFLKEQNPGLTALHVVSDGPTTQYRSKKNFFLLSTLPFEMGWTKVTWNFMEAGHGKGPADGVGAAVKQKADRMVAMGKDISSPKTLFNELLASKTNIKLFFIENEEIDTIDSLLPDDLQTVRGTMTIHQVSLFNSNNLKFTVGHDIKLIVIWQW